MTSPPEGSLRVLVEESPLGIFALRSGRFLFANRAISSLLGHSTEQLDHAAVADIVAPADHERVLRELDAHEGDPEPLHLRFEGRRADGSSLRLELFTRSVEWHDGSALVGVLLDVTDAERKHEQALRKQRIEAMSLLAGAAAHDFSQALTAIVGALSLGLSSLAVDHPARSDIEQAQRTAARASKFTRQLLTFGRRRPGRNGPVDVGDELKRLRPDLQRLCGERVRISLELAAQLPPVPLDPTALEHMMFDMIGNALDAIPGTGRIQLRGSSREADDPRLRRRDGVPSTSLVVIEIADSGRGIDPKDRLEVFLPFYSTKPGSRGLGLAAVHGLVAGAGGFIRVDSRVGRGTSFQIHLPTAEAQPARRSRDANPEMLVVASILLVDDENVVRSVTGSVLRRLGYDVHEAKSVTEAREMIERRAGRFDLLLSDVTLPDGNGFDVAETFRAHHPAKPIIFTSGYSEQEVVGRARSEGASFLEKPYDVHRLARAVADSLTHARGGSLRRSLVEE
jgi:two-component system, cell cycle sensor histidine kinase and response regulator CckA